MPIVYWIEDEGYLLISVKEELEQRGCLVHEIQTAPEVRSMLDRVRALPGPIIVDLWLPTHENAENDQLLGIDVGLWVIAQIREELGSDWPLFVLSGNLPLSVVETLRKKHGMSQEAIFHKPLCYFDTFVDAVVEQASKMARES